MQILAGARPFLVILIGFIFNLSGCATPLPRALDKVEMGMAKDEVLEIAGNPRRTRRWKGKDEWTYVYYVDNQEKHTEIHFDQGKVVFKGDRDKAVNLKEQVEKSRTLEEYEYRAKKYLNSDQYEQNQKENFQEIPAEE